MPSHNAQFKSPFGPIQFTPEEEDGLRDVADSLLNHNLEMYEEFVANNSRIDPNRWDLVVQHDNVRVFNDKTKHGKDLTTLLTHGWLRTNLDDFQYAVNCPGVELTMVKSPYIKDRVTDCANLATIEAPTLDKPFNSLCVKWFIKGQSFLARAITKNRDVVYIESSKFMTLKSGERIGSHLFHSIAFPQAPLLPGSQRGNISLCGFTRQVGPNCVETYVNGLIDGGNAPRSLVVKSAAEIAGGTYHYPNMTLMKKLSWCLRRQAFGGNNGPCASIASSPLQCAVCSNKFTVLHRSPRNCALCHQRICSNCRVKKTLSAFFRDRNDLATMEFSFCILCLHRAEELSAVDIGRDEVLRQDGGMGFGRPPRSVYASSSTGLSDD